MREAGLEVIAAAVIIAREEGGAGDRGKGVSASRFQREASTGVGRADSSH